ncbi:WD repeat-containing protein 73 isoform X2 [Oryzias latipes]|uniref:WD repeat-containing protein 73 isoform X2 n=1 Tax=Oryzias latipes TaxID=8090 RepID=UPI0005CC742F|nr:WD repeat-containing protein 73 isoform X2 [Oryzias latipes]
MFISWSIPPRSSSGHLGKPFAWRDTVPPKTSSWSFDYHSSFLQKKTRVSVQSGISNFSMVVSQTGQLAASDISQHPGRLIVTNDGQGTDLQVWDLGGDDSDVIRRTGTVKGRESAQQCGSRIAASPSSSPQVLHGAESGSVQLTQLTSGQSLYKLETDTSDPLNSLQFTSDAVFLAGCSNGRIYMADTRVSAAPQMSPPPASSGQSAVWWTDATADPQQASCRVVRLSSSGHAVVSDLRKLGEAVCQAQLDIHCSSDNVTVSWAPRRNYISASGFSGVVDIYDTRDWRIELRRVQPLFQHRGHEVSCKQADGCDPVCITAHVWHPERPQTLLSTASDGSVHVWDWVEPDSKRAESKSEPSILQDQK